jgi:hypothetical protein
MNDEAEIACSLMGPELAARKAKITRELFAHAEEATERHDGYAYRFPSETPWPGKVLEFIEAERECCPFLRFEVAFEPNHGPLWLTLSGRGEIKSFITNELGLAGMPD